MITESQLSRIMPNLAGQKLQIYLPHLNAAMQTYGVNTMIRTAAFVAQLAHESAEFRFMEELWGPIPAQVRYEPPSDLAKRLGNTQPGDGKRFKGRGPIQITGRFNYKKYGDLLSVDLVSQPELAAQPAVAFSTAGLFWKTNGLNELADTEEFITITRRINGGTNGLPDRQKYYARAKDILADGFVAAPVPVTRGAPRSMAPRMPVGPLTRGAELMTAFEEAAAADPTAGSGIVEKSVAKKGVTWGGCATGVAKKPARKVATRKEVSEKVATHEAALMKAALMKAAEKKVAAKKVALKKDAAKKMPAKKAKAKKVSTRKAHVRKPAP